MRYTPRLSHCGCLPCRSPILKPTPKPRRKPGAKQHCSACLLRRASRIRIQSKVTASETRAPSSAWAREAQCWAYPKRRIFRLFRVKAGRQERLWVLALLPNNPHREPLGPPSENEVRSIELAGLAASMALYCVSSSLQQAKAHLRAQLRRVVQLSLPASRRLQSFPSNPPKHEEDDTPVPRESSAYASPRSGGEAGKP